MDRLMKRASLAVMVVALAASVSGCIAIGWGTREKTDCQQPRKEEQANWRSLIEATRMVGAEDRFELLLQLAQRPDLTSMDRTMIVNESKSLSAEHRTQILRALAGGKQ